MAVHRIQNAYLVVRDMAAQRSFYEGALGLELKFADRQRWAQFSLGEANFSLSSPDEAADGACGVTIVFEGQDIEAMAQKIVDAGGRVTGRRDMGSHGHTVTFADPEGNLAQLFERTSNKGS